MKVPTQSKATQKYTVTKTRKPRATTPTKPRSPTAPLRSLIKEKPSKSAKSDFIADSSIESQAAYIKRMKKSGFYLCSKCKHQLFHIQSCSSNRADTLTFSDSIGDIDFDADELLDTAKVDVS